MDESQDKKIFWASSIFDIFRMPRHALLDNRSRIFLYGVVFSHFQVSRQGFTNIKIHVFG